MCQLLDDEANFQQFTLKSHKNSSFVHLDSAALKALHIEDSIDQTGNETLVKLMDKTRSPNGKKLLHQWIRQPLIDINKIGLCDICKIASVRYSS